MLSVRYNWAIAHCVLGFLAAIITAWCVCRDEILTGHYCQLGCRAGLRPNGWEGKIRAQRPSFFHPPVRTNADWLPSYAPQNATAVSSRPLTAGQTTQVRSHSERSPAQSLLNCFHAVSQPVAGPRGRFLAIAITLIASHLLRSKQSVARKGSK